MILTRAGLLAHKAFDEVFTPGAYWPEEKAALSVIAPLVITTRSLLVDGSNHVCAGGAKDYRGQEDERTIFRPHRQGGKREPLRPRCGVVHQSVGVQREGFGGEGLGRDVGHIRSGGITKL